MTRSEAQAAIEADLRAGAVDNYLAGDDALELLGDIMKIFKSKGEPGEWLQEQLRRIDTAVGSYLEKACDKIVADNLQFVLEANAPSQRRALLPNHLAFNGTGVAA
jgi:hypothetical protein